MRNRTLAAMVAALTAIALIAVSVETTFGWSPPLETTDYAGAQTLFAHPATLQAWDSYGAHARSYRTSDGRRFAIIDVVVNDGQQAVEFISRDEFNNETSAVAEVEGYPTPEDVVIPAGLRTGVVIFRDDTLIWDQLNLHRLSGLSLKISSHHRDEGFFEADIQTVEYCKVLDCQTITGDAGAIYLSSIIEDTPWYPRYESSIP